MKKRKLTSTQKAYLGVRNNLAVQAQFMTGGGSHRSEKDKIKSRKGKHHQKMKKELSSYY